MMRAWLFGLLALGTLAPQARATTGIGWRWGDNVERRYLLQAQVRLPEMIPVKSLTNTDLRVVEYYLAVVTRCTSSVASKKTWELLCTFEDVQFDAAPPRADANRGLKELLDEWDQLLLGTTAQIVFSRDGLIRNVSLEGVNTRIRRFREIEETLRLLLLRDLAGLELQTPKSGDDRGRPWQQKDSLAVDLPKSMGSFGSVRLLHTVGEEREGSVVVIDTTGEALVSSGETVGAPGGERMRNVFDMEVRGRSRFDLEAGTLVSRDYIVTGEPTASSALATGVAGTLYVQAVHVELIPREAEVTPLGENHETVPGENGI
ncbi:MAG TPA: hypothetical protein ENK18_09425 [Deltaproteobacteria bacterium]|nr:hypothetical protein [Deltaproteobacteria bacterium]